MRTRILLRLVLVVLPTVGLMFIWLAFLPRQGQASSLAAIIQPAGEQTPTQAPTPAATPDPRWVDIIRARDSVHGAAPEAAPPSINLNLTDGTVAGRVASPAVVEVVLIDQGQVIGSLSVLPVPDGGGFFYLASFSWYMAPFQPGYEVWVKQGLTTISMTVPVLTGLAYPQTDVLSGTAPANAALLAYLFPAASPGEVYTRTTTAGGDGAYQLDWAPAVDLRPQDSGYILYVQDPGRQAYIGFVSPFLRPQVGSSGLSGAAAPYSTVEIVVMNDAGGQVGELTAFAGSNGFFSFNCNGGGGGEGVGGYYDEFVFSPSDRVIAVADGQTFSMTVITLTAQADRQAGQVWGQAPASQPVEVLRFAGPLSGYGECFWYQQPLNLEIVTATADGGYTAALPLETADYGAVLAPTPDGNQVYARFAVPYMNVSLGKPDYNYTWTRIWGQVAEPSVPITVEVQGPSGYLKDWYTLTAWGDGYFNDRNISYPDLTIESGDLVTLTTPHTPPVSLLLPVLTAAADINTGIVSGQAPPFSPLTVRVFYTDLQVVITATAEGQYSADFSSLGGLPDNTLGEVEWTSAEGYHATRYFDTGPDYDCPPRIVAAQVGGNMVQFNSSHQCGMFTFRLRGADGALKIEQDFIGDVSTYFLYDLDAQPVFILTGDQLELEYYGQPATTPVPPAPFPTATPFTAQRGDDGDQHPIPAGVQVEIAVVPVLTVSLDPQADQVSGQAPPGAVIDLRPDLPPLLITTTASTEGAYHFNLAGLFDLQAGSRLRIGIQGTPYFYALSFLPEINAVLYGYDVYGLLTPFVPFTITLSSPITVTSQVTGHTESNGWFQKSLYPPPEGGPFPQPGDLLEVETPARFWQTILPWLTAHVDVSTGVVSGEAPPDSRLSVYLNTEGPTSSQIVTATASGTYSATFPIFGDVGTYSGYVKHFTTDDMRTILRFSSPSWDVTLESRRVSGYAPMDGVPFTVTLRSGDGSFSQSIYTNTLGGYFYHNYFDVDFQRAVYPGDHLSLETIDGVMSEFTVPYLAAVHDFPRHVLEGRAPAGGELFAYIPNNFGIVSRHIRLAPDGHFGVDTSDLNTWVGWQGRVIFIDRLGNKVTRLFYIRGYPGYLPLIRLLVTP